MGMGGFWRIGVFFRTRLFFHRSANFRSAVAPKICKLQSRLKICATLATSSHSPAATAIDQAPSISDLPRNTPAAPSRPRNESLCSNKNSRHHFPAHVFSTTFSRHRRKSLTPVEYVCLSRMENLPSDHCRLPADHLNQAIVSRSLARLDISWRWVQAPTIELRHSWTGTRIGLLDLSV